jgi:hypothetical protein
MQDPPKFTKVGIFGLKICHLATLLEKSLSGLCQGDQIGRIFAYWMIVCFWAVRLKITEVPSQKLWATLFGNCNNFDKKICWSTFWATFVQTRLVTVASGHQGLNNDSLSCSSRAKALSG